MNKEAINLSTRGGLDIKFGILTLRCILSAYINISRRMHPYEACEVVGASEFLPMRYALDVKRIYRFYGARTEKQKSFVDGTLIALFEKIISWMEMCQHGVLYSDIDKFLCRKEKESFEELCLLGIFGIKEASDYLNELVLFVDLDSCFLMDSGKIVTVEAKKKNISSNRASLSRKSAISTEMHSELKIVSGILNIAAAGV